MTQKATLLLFLITCTTLLSAERVNVRDFGAVGDAVTDDTEAVREAFKASAEVHFPSGVYVLNDGIRLPENARITGAGAPRMGTFPMTEDDKRFMREGEKHKLTGTTLLFKGSGRKSASLSNRSDQFSSFRFAVATAERHPFHVEGLAIVLDVNVFDESGKLTTPDTDGNANYDVGLFVDDAGFGTVRDVTIYGFYKKAGLLISTRGIGGNPDYNTFWNCSFMGNVGVALLGDDQPSERLTYGLSGTQFYGCNFYAMDHHHRKSAEFGQTAILIDGHTNARSADLNGHYFFGGGVRTYSPNAVTLKAASNVVFYGSVFELPNAKWGDIDYGERDNRITGTEDTRDVSFYSCRMHYEGLDDLARTMKNGRLFVVQGHYGDIVVHSNGTVARLYANANERAIFQLSDNNYNAFSGWGFDFRASERDILRLLFDNREIARFESDGRLVVDSIENKQAQSAQTLSRGPGFTLGETETVELNNKQIKIESAVVEVSNPNQESILGTIRGGVENQLLVLRKDPDYPSFRLEEHGNLRLASSVLLDDRNDRITLIKNGKNWFEISRVGGGKPAGAAK